MGKMKQGTFVTLDKNYGNICVGDHIKDADGFIYKIDAYGRAVRKADRTKHSIKDLDGPEYYNDPEEKASETPNQRPTPVDVLSGPSVSELKKVYTDIKAAKRAGNEAAAPRKRKQSRSKESASAQVTLAEATDQMLADELRRRGYKLTAKKTVNIKL